MQSDRITRHYHTLYPVPVSIPWSQLVAPPSFSLGSRAIRARNSPPQRERNLQRHRLSLSSLSRVRRLGGGRLRSDRTDFRSIALFDAREENHTIGLVFCLSQDPILNNIDDLVRIRMLLIQRVTKTDKTIYTRSERRDLPDN